MTSPARPVEEPSLKYSGVRTVVFVLILERLLTSLAATCIMFLSMEHSGFSRRYHCAALSTLARLSVGRLSHYSTQYLVRVLGSSTNKYLSSAVTVSLSTSYFD